jgi:hypothetical protein
MWQPLDDIGLASYRIHQAAGTRHIAVAEISVQHGSNLKTGDLYGYTSFHRAGHDEICGNQDSARRHESVISVKQPRIDVAQVISTYARRSVHPRTGRMHTRLVSKLLPEAKS